VTASIPALTAQLSELAGGGGDAVAACAELVVSGPRQVLPSVFDVTGVAAAAVGAAGSAVSELVAARYGGSPPVVRVDTRQACVAFMSELAFTPIGWERDVLLDPVTGDYPTADGWIRLHANYAAHLRAALRALGLSGGATRDAVAAIVRDATRDELEQAVVDAGGAAAVMRTVDSWRHHPHGQATVAEPPLRVAPAAPAQARRWVDSDGSRDRPLAGVRVLDLTRVIAGPVCTRVLAGLGADVLRIDPPGFEEVAALLPDTTVGKRCAAVDLRADDDRHRFGELVDEADVIVHGLRPGAMAGLGFGPEALRERNAGIVTACLDAYGWTGPWAGRRGFDSLVQMSTGIAAAGAADAHDGPRPLPAQALDHATGYLLAAAVIRGLARRLTSGQPVDIRASLLGTANVVLANPLPDAPALERPSFEETDTIPVATAWGRARAAPCPVTVDGCPPRWDIDAGPLGRHPAAFA
jgi:crotonobetainyl-CoA:carnitine CoA-transferase CaiB-like acyl-CoA transferase